MLPTVSSLFFAGFLLNSLSASAAPIATEELNVPSEVLDALNLSPGLRPADEDSKFMLHDLPIPKNNEKTVESVAGEPVERKSAEIPATEAILNAAPMGAQFWAKPGKLPDSLEPQFNANGDIQLIPKYADSAEDCGLYGAAVDLINFAEYSYSNFTWLSVASTAEDSYIHIPEEMFVEFLLASGASAAGQDEEYTMPCGAEPAKTFRMRIQSPPELGERMASYRFVELFPDAYLDRESEQNGRCRVLLRPTAQTDEPASTVHFPRRLRAELCRLMSAESGSLLRIEAVAGNQIQPPIEA